MKRRSIALAGAIVLSSPILARADAGLPRLSSPDWSSLSTPHWAGVGLLLTLAVGWLGLWATRRPAAAIGIFLWLLGLPFLMIGGLMVAVGIGYQSYLAIPFAVAGLGIAMGLAIAGYKVMKTNGEWSGRAVVPGLVGLFALVLILGLTGSALHWTEPRDPNRPAPPPGAVKVQKRRKAVKIRRFLDGPIALFSLVETVRADVAPPLPPPFTIPGARAPCQ